MAWNKREGLNVLSSKNDFIEHTSYNQNTLAKISLARVISTVLGGPGLYRQDGSNSIDVLNTSAGTAVPPVNLLIADSSDELWFFSTEANVAITFSYTGSGAGKLYAVIGLIAPTPSGGAAAIGGYANVTFIAQASATVAPANSILIGTGNITASAFTTFTEQTAVTFPPVVTTLLWQLTVDAGVTTQDISDSDTLDFVDDNGTENSVLNGDVIAKYVLQSSSGLQVDQNQLAILPKPSLTIHTDIDGIYRDITEVDTFSFTVAGNLGSPQTISKGETLSILGTGAFKTTSITNGTRIDLNLLSAGGIYVNGSSELAVKVVGGGKLSTGANGLARSLSQFSLVGTTGTPDTFYEDETIYILGSNAIQTKSEADQKLNVDLLLANSTEGGHESGLKVVNGKLKVAVDPQSNIEIGDDGLYVAKRSPAAYYGYPDTGTWVEGDLFTDKSGANWRCITAGSGLTAKWLQISVGRSAEVAGTPNLPQAATFYGGYRPHSYRILAYDNTTSKIGKVWMWFNWGRENDYEIGFWISEDLNELNWNQDTDWTIGNRNNLFDIQEYNYYVDFRLNLYNQYDGYFVDRTKLSIIGQGYSGKMAFYHQDIDYKYYETTFASSGNTYSTFDAQGRAFKKTATRHSLLGVIATNTDVSSLITETGLKSTIRYIVDQDSTLFDS